jgi:phage terminase small subunit
MALSGKQRVFVAEYTTNGFNATQAAISAGYSRKTADSTGWENLKKPEIATEIERAISHRCMTQEEILIRLAEQGRAEYSEYIKEDGSVDLAGLKFAGKMHLVKGIKETAAGRTVEFYDAFSALVQVGRAHKMFTDKQENTTELTGALTLQDWHKQAASSRKQATATLADFEDDPE